MENERIKNKVVGMLTNIIDEVDPRNMLDLLIERRIVSIEYREKIMNKETKKDRCRALIYHLLECSQNEAFIVFRKALEEHYPWIVDRIDAVETDTENQDHFKIREEQLMKELNETKLKLQEGNRKTDELQKVLRSTKTVLEEAKREIEILKQELEQKIKLECTASGTQNNIPNETVRENEKIKDQVISIYTDFVSGVDPMNVFDLLIKNRIVSLKQKKTVMKKITAKERCRALIDHLFLCSKENAFIVLKEALKGHYPKIVEYLDAFDSDDENEDDYSTSKLENERIRNKIVAIYSDFVSDVDSLSVFDNLIENKIVNIKQKQLIVKKSANKEERCRALLDHLLFCSKEKAFIILREALKEHYPVIVERIDTCDTDKQIEFSTRFESCIIVAGFNNDEEIGKDVVKIKLNGTKEVYNMEPLPPQMTKESAAAVYDNLLFVTGLAENRDKIWRFDARSSKWEYCNTMIRGRRRHSVAFVDHVLYICGGWVDAGEITLDDVEAYDTIDDRCTTVGKLVHAVQGAGNCVPFKSSLYIFGGRNANDKSVDYVQVYDTKQDSCTLLSKRMPVSRGLLRAVLWENKAILLGQYNCLVYNFDTESWQMRDQFKTDVIHFGLIVHNGKLFVIGGGRDEVDVDGNRKWIYRDDVKSVPVENVLNNESIEWLHHANLPKPSLVQSFGKIEFLVQ